MHHYQYGVSPPPQQERLNVALMRCAVGSVWSNVGMAAPKNARAVAGRPASTRERIVSAAEQLFDDAGLGRVNVADIAEYAGIHRVTVYRHFTDRGAILDEVLLRRARPVLERTKARLAQAERFPADFAYVMVAAVDEARHVPGLLQAMAVERDGESVRTRVSGERFIASAVEIVKPHLLVVQEQGKMRADLSVDETVKWLLQVGFSWLFLSQDESPAVLLDRCMTYVMPALVAD